MAFSIKLAGWVLDDTVFHEKKYMVNSCKQQNFIMNFAVTFLKMFALYVLWRTQILLKFCAIFCVY